MASTNDAIKVVDVADVEDGGGLAKVESIEKVSLFSFLTGSKKDDEEGKSEQDSSSGKKEHVSGSHRKVVVHEGEGIRSTYDVEEDVPPSLLEQLKRKIHWNGR